MSFTEDEYAKFPLEFKKHYDRLRKILREEYDVPQGWKVDILFWHRDDHTPRIGTDLRIAEINFSHGRGGSAYMQSDPDHGALIFHCERYLLEATDPEDDKEFHRDEMEHLEWLLRHYIREELKEVDAERKAKNQV